MAHQIAKLLLEHADTFLEKKKAIQSALELGMPLNEIEEYLDWLEFMRSQNPSDEKKKTDPIDRLVAPYAKHSELA